MTRFSLVLGFFALFLVRQPVVAIEVISEYGQDLVSPLTGTTVTDGDTVAFTAPNTIFLNRFGEELTDGTPAQRNAVAFYRIRLTGYTLDTELSPQPINGEATENSEQTVFAHAVNDDDTIRWHWAIDYAAEIESGENTGEGQAGHGNPDPPLSKHWVNPGELFSPSVDSSVNLDTNGAPTERLNLFAYVLDNDTVPIANASTNRRALALDGTEVVRWTSLSSDPFPSTSGQQPEFLGNGTTPVTADGVTYEPGVTVEFWARQVRPTVLDTGTLPTDANLVAAGATVLSIGQVQTIGGHQTMRLDAGFTAASDANANDSRPYFVLPHNGGNGTKRFVSDYMTNDGWHHYAWVYDHHEEKLSLYVDGGLVDVWTGESLSFDPQISSGYAALQSVGGRTRVGGTIDKHFTGALNNLRTWRSPLTQEQVRNLMVTERQLLAPSYTVSESDTTFTMTRVANADLEFAAPPQPTLLLDLSFDFVAHYMGKENAELLAMDLDPSNPENSTQDILFFGAVLNGANSLRGQVFRLDSIDEDRLELNLLSSTRHVSDGSTKTLHFDRVVYGPVSIEAELAHVSGLPTRTRFQVIGSDLETGELLSPIYELPDGGGSVAVTTTEEFSFVESVVWTSRDVPDITGSDFRDTIKKITAPNRYSTDSLESYAKVLAPSSRIVSGEFPARLTVNQEYLSDWLGMTYFWRGEVFYQTQASLGGLPSGSVEDLHFILVGADPDNRTAYVGTNAENGVWVELGTQVTVGTAYRLGDNTVTLQSLSAHGDLTSALQLIDVEDLEDGIIELEIDGVTETFVTRQTTLVAESATTVNWGFDETVYTAFVPLGSSFSVASDTFIPALSGTLDTSIPSNSLAVTTTPDSNFASLSTSSGNGVIWDAVGGQIWPVQPGVHTIEWPDADDSSITYTIQIVAGFPGETIDLDFDVEEEDGSGTRVTDGDGLTVSSYTFAEDVSDSFPASPDANYHLVYDANAQNTPKVSVDPDATDSFYFQPGFWFISDSGIALDTNGLSLSATADGKATMVWSYRPNEGEVANGDPTREGFIVRVIESENLEGIESAMAHGDYLEAAFDGLSSSEIELVNSADETFQGSTDENGMALDFTIEFWAKSDSLTSSPQLFDIEFLNDNPSGSGDGSFAWQVSLAPPADEDSGNLFTVALSADGNAFPIANPTEGPVVGIDWHHWAFVFDGTSLEYRIYMDDVLVLSQAGVPSTAFGAGNWKLQLLQLGVDTVGSIDNFRLWPRVLSVEELRLAASTGLVLADISDETSGNLSNLLGSLPSYNLTFDNYDAESTGSLTVAYNSGDEPVTRIQTYDGKPEVATRILSKLDRAGFESGLVVRSNSNYNANLYDPDALPGEWGPLFPVNHGLLFTGDKELEVIFYENPSELQQSDVLHPNVAWPYHAIPYNDVTFPETGVNANKRIYIASRLGTEGVAEEDLDGDDLPDHQLLFDPSLYSGVSVYNQPDPDAAGYNPNEEHALVAPSAKHILSGDDSFDLDQNAVFAFQNELNYRADVEDLEVIDPLDSLVLPLNRGNDEVQSIIAANRAVNGKVTVVAKDASGDDLDLTVSIVGTLSGGMSGNETLSISGTTTVTSSHSYSYVESITITDAGAVVTFNPSSRHFEVESRSGTADDSLTVTAPSPRATTDPDLYTSDPWVLVQYFNESTQEDEMAAYKVEKTRGADEASAFTGADGEAFPILDQNGAPTTDPDGTPNAIPGNPFYYFDYPFQAGVPVTAPYPLNTIILSNMSQDSGGNILLDTDRDGGIDADDTHRRALWFDKELTPWVVSGDGRFFYKFWYPFRADFWYEDVDTNGKTATNDIGPGTPFAFIPSNLRYTEADGAQAGNVFHSTYWGDAYPVLKRGETLTYSGGEFHADNPTSPVLPDVVNMASAQVVFDGLNPSMIYNYDETATTSDEVSLSQYGLQIVNPLSRTTSSISFADFTQTLGLTPADTDSINTNGPRYYFPQLTGSLQSKIFYDSQTFELTYLGLLNGYEINDPELPLQPTGLYLLEPAFMSDVESTALTDTSIDSYSGTWQTAIADSIWSDAIAEIRQKSRDLNDLYTIDANTTWDVDGTPLWELMILSGFGRTADEPTQVEQPGFWQEASYNVALDSAVEESTYVPVNATGSGLALVPNNALLNADTDQELYVTIAENNHPDASGAVTLHVIEISTERVRGNVKLITPNDRFSEKVNIAHTSDFGGDTSDVWYEWWVRKSASLDSVGLPEDANGGAVDPEWVVIDSGFGKNMIDFRANPVEALSDKLFYVRYGDREDLEELDGGGVVTSVDDSYTVLPEAWRRVSLDPADEDTYAKTSNSLVPFQWAGAAQSPTLGSDGNYSYVPQLVPGWVKRVLADVNPFEARYADLYNNESPATYTSILQSAGGPYEGNVALNDDKDAVESVGLIELYETVLSRATELADSNPDGGDTDQAVLLASTRLATLYEVLAQEAYTDAQDPTVTTGTTPKDLDNALSYSYAFYNLYPSVLHETLALLRGNDRTLSTPVFNRVVPNFTAGIGEAAYVSNYNIYDTAQSGSGDGFIDIEDALRLYPQGHGDAWGHFLSALQMHYGLLKSEFFEWEAIPELYPLIDNVVEVDFMDERTFARIAAARARTGLQIVRDTYRAAYVHDPDGQYQGYEDNDLDRAWGVSEWANRAGQGAYFDWLTANAIQPLDASDDEDLDINDVQEGLTLIDRRVNEREIRGIARSFTSLQGILNAANEGINPIGIDEVAFDLDPSLIEGTGVIRSTFFEQVYEKAVTALNNANAALEMAASFQGKIVRNTNDTAQLQADVFNQDTEFRNRLIAIFGTPYDGTIGPGQLYEEGYNGPDTALYLYIDETDWTAFVPDDSAQYYTNLKKPESWITSYKDLNFSRNSWATPQTGNGVETIFNSMLIGTGVGDGTGDHAFNTASVTEANRAEVEISITDKFGLTAPPEWGSRSSNGKIQDALNKLLLQELDLRHAQEGYIGMSKRLTSTVQAAENELKLLIAKQKNSALHADTLITFESLRVAFSILRTELNITNIVAEGTYKELETVVPRVVGLANDPFGGVRASIGTIGLGISNGLAQADAAIKNTELINKFIATQLERDLKVQDQYLSNYDAVNKLAKEVSQALITQTEARRTIAVHKQAVEIAKQELVTAIDEGFRVLDERNAFNTGVAGAVNRSRYVDLMNRVSRSEALTFYNDSFVNAQRFAWMAAKVYDYETSLTEDSPYNAQGVLTDIIRESNVGLIDGSGNPQIGQGGLAEVLAKLKANYGAMKSQLGLDNPQTDESLISLRSELFRIKSGTTTSNALWKQELQSKWVADLRTDPIFRRYCRPFVDDSAPDPQPALVIEFGTSIKAGHNLFGWPLGPDDNAFSSADFATRIRRIGMQLDGYAEAGLAVTPRFYLLPIGTDVFQTSDDFSGGISYRRFNVVEQVIPAPFPINDTELDDTDYRPSINGLDGSFSQIKRAGDFPAQGVATEFGVSTTNSSLVGRSVWNDRWILIIPGIHLNADPEFGLNQFIEHVDDIQLYLETYSTDGL